MDTFYHTVTLLSIYFFSFNVKNFRISVTLRENWKIINSELKMRQAIEKNKQSENKHTTDNSDKEKQITSSTAKKSTR